MAQLAERLDEMALVVEAALRRDRLDGHVRSREKLACAVDADRREIGAWRHFEDAGEGAAEGRGRQPRNGGEPRERDLLGEVVVDVAHDPLDGAVPVCRLGRVWKRSVEAGRADDLSALVKDRKYGGNARSRRAVGSVGRQPVQDGSTGAADFAVELEVFVGQDGREELVDPLPDGLVFVAEVAVRAVLLVESDDAVLIIDDVESNARQRLRKVAQRLGVLARALEKGSLKALGTRDVHGVEILFHS